MSNDKISKFYIMFTFVILTLTFAIPSLVFTFSSVLATSSNNNNDSEESRANSDQSSNDENQQQQESDIDEESNGENSNNDNDQSPTESQNTTADSTQGLTLQNDNQIPLNALSGNLGIQERPRDNAVLTSSNITNTLVPIKPDSNLENSPGNLNVILKVECKSTNGQPSDKAVCDTYTREPEFIQPNDYSLTLDVTRNGTNYKSVFTGSSEGQSFTIKPGGFDIYGISKQDAYAVVGKKGGYSQFNYIDFNPSTTGDCQNVPLSLEGQVSKLQVKGTIYPLANHTCTITMEVEYNNFILPKSSFADMLQNQRIPDVVIQK